MKILKIRGPDMEPCGMPLFNSFQLFFKLLTFALCLRLYR